MAKTYRLTVQEMRRDTRDSVVVTFAPDSLDAPDFEYIQGQYLTLIRSFDGEELRRCYSIAAARADRCLRVGVRKIDNGTMSGWINDELQVGDQIDALAPSGNFHSPIEPRARKGYLMFAGGSGITPVIGLIKTILDEEPDAFVTLVYGNRSVNVIMFREELEDLKNSYLERLAITHVLEHDASDIDLFTGRLDRDKCRALFESWIDVSRFDQAFICGPEPMMQAVATALQSSGMDKANIKYELFAASPLLRNYTGAQAAGADGDSAGVVGAGSGGGSGGSTGEGSTGKCRVSLHLDGRVRAFDMPRRGVSVVDAALAEGLDVPHSCKAGVCSSCRAKVVAGEVEMIANHALEDYEVAAGYVLTCQSHPLSDELEIDYDK